MKFLVFIAVVFVIGLFHRREHILYESGLFELRKKLETDKPDANEVRDKLKGMDWRLVGIDRTYALLKRSFNVPGKEDVLRYVVPVTVLCVLIVYLEVWTIAALYGAALALKWFVAETALDLDPFTPRYEARLFGKRLFGQQLATAPHEGRVKKDKEMSGTE